MQTHPGLSAAFSQSASFCAGYPSRDTFQLQNSQKVHQISFIYTACAGWTDGRGCLENHVLLSNCCPTKGVECWTAHRENPFPNCRQTLLHRGFEAGQPSQISAYGLTFAATELQGFRIQSLQVYFLLPFAIATTSSKHHLNTDFCNDITSEKHTQAHKWLWQVGKRYRINLWEELFSAQEKMKLNSEHSLSSYCSEPLYHTLCRGKRPFIVSCREVKREAAPTTWDISLYHLSTGIKWINIWKCGNNKLWKNIVLSLCKDELRQKVDK